MIWLASYPRSGNTFFRILLDEVYGISSSAFHKKTGLDLDADYAQHPVVKTHLLPEELVPTDASVPAVYLVRDGRDSVISLAHQMCNMTHPGTDFEDNLREAILAFRGRFFGGWSEHVARWLPRASLVIKFEDLIADPLAQIERLREVMELPPPREDRIPTFGDLRSNTYRYGSGPEGSPDEIRTRRRQSFFRRGRSGAWRDEMPDDLHALYWRVHGKGMERLGYEREAGVSSRRCGAAEYWWQVARMACGLAKKARRRGARQSRESG